MFNLNLSNFPLEIKQHIIQCVGEEKLDTVRLLNHHFNDLANDALGKLFQTIYHSDLIATPVLELNHSLFNDPMTKAQSYLYNKKVMALIKKVWEDALASKDGKIIKGFNINHLKMNTPLSIIPVNASRLLASGQSGMKPLSFVPEYHVKDNLVKINHEIEQNQYTFEKGTDHLLYDYDHYILRTVPEMDLVEMIEKNNPSLVSKISLEDFGIVVNSNENFLYSSSKGGQVKKYAFVEGSFSEVMCMDLKMKEPIEWMELIGENKQFWLAGSRDTLFVMDEKKQQISFQYPLEGKFLITEKYLLRIASNRTLNAIPMENLLKNKPLEEVEIVKDVSQLIKGEGGAVFMQDSSGNFQILNPELEVIRSGTCSESISCFASKDGFGAFAGLSGKINIFSSVKDQGSSFCTLDYSHLGSIRSLYWTDTLSLLAGTSKGNFIFISPFPLKITSNAATH